MNARPYRHADLDKCVGLFIHVFNAEPWNDNWLRNDAAQYLNAYVRSPGFIGIVAEDGSEIKGFVFGIRKKWWSGDECFVQEMCVRQEAQRSGIGTELLKELERTLRDEEIARMTLLTSRGIPAEAFYRKNGFKGIDSLIFMTKSIRQD